MSAQEHKTLVEQYAEEVWTQGRIEATDKYVASKYIRHDPGIPFEVRGPEGIKQLVTLYRAAFPDIDFTAADVIAEEDKVVVRWDIRGTHRGELMGIAPTGREVRLMARDLPPRGSQDCRAVGFGRQPRHAATTWGFPACRGWKLGVQGPRNLGAACMTQ